MHLERDSNGTVAQVTLIKPADMHHHFRQDDLLKLVGPMVAKRFYTAIVMPNTTPPMTDPVQVDKYRQEVVAATGANFTPLMTMYLTDKLSADDVAMSLNQTLIAGVKYYPRGLTTNSDSGVADPSALWTPGTKPFDCLRALADNNGVLLLHAADGVDAHGNELDPYDQEKHFLKETLPSILDEHPSLKVSVEHMSTAEGAEEMRYWGKHRPGKTGCSLTAQHLLLDRRDVFRGGFRTHKHWWPIIQPQEHKQELRKFAAEDHPYVWLGSDSAPHPRDKKESDCCVGGVMMVHAGIELYAEAFDLMKALDDRFERFASLNGPRFFGIDQSPETITLRREEWKVRDYFYTQELRLDRDPRQVTTVPFRLNESILWKLV